MSRRHKLRLPFSPRPEPELTRDEVDWVLGVALDRVEEHERVMSRAKVSESVIRSKSTGESVIEKLRQAEAVDPQLRTYEDRLMNRMRR